MFQRFAHRPAFRAPRPPRRGPLATVLAAASVVTAPVAAAALVAASAADVCPASADPCVVSAAIDVAAGARLDFGLRALRIEGGGLLDFPSGGEVLCGRLEVATSGVAIRARGSASDAAAPATVVLEIRRRCALAPTTPCLVESDCAAVGGGSCSAGDGTAVIDGAVTGRAERPGRIVLRSAGELSLLQPASVAGTRSISDGGTLDLESTGAAVRIAAPLDVSGGSVGSGGSLEAIAATDVLVQARVAANGGDYDGGAVTLAAGRDAVVAGEIRADALAGAGFGGEIDVAADRDIVVSGGTATNFLVIGADGHQSVENIGGDGGIAVFDAGRDILVSRHVRFSAEGAAPDGFADTLSFVAGGDIVFEGRVQARGRGSQGGGGLLEFLADGDVRLPASVVVDLTGAAAGGDLAIESGGRFETSASVDVSGSATGLGGRVVAVAGADVELGGRWYTGGAASTFSVGDFLVEGCRVQVAGDLVNAAESGRNRFVARETISVDAAATVVAFGEGATNEIRYRSLDARPVVAGLVAPAASLVADPGLAVCPVCGNLEVEVGETCDDGNTATGDGCSPLCREEDCGAGFAVDSLLLRRASGDRPGHAKWKGEFPLARLDVDPAGADVRVVLSGADARVLLDATIPAGSFAGDEGQWWYRAPADDVASGADGEVVAGAVVRASLQVEEPRQVVRFRFKVRNLDVGEEGPALPLALGMVLGDVSQDSPCTGCVPLACEARRRRIACRSQPLAPGAVPSNGTSGRGAT